MLYSVRTRNGLYGYRWWQWVGLALGALVAAGLAVAL